MDLKGVFRIRLADASKFSETLLRLTGAPKTCDDVHATATTDVYEEALNAALEEDTGWSPNIVTDVGRRALLDVGWGTSAYRLFISEATPPGNARRTSVQFTYSNQTPSQLLTPSIATNDSGLLLQTRAGTYSQPTVARTINLVGLTGATSLVNNAVHMIVAYTKLSTPVLQGTTQVADVQYRVTWSI